MPQGFKIPRSGVVGEALDQNATCVLVEIAYGPYSGPFSVFFFLLWWLYSGCFLCQSGLASLLSSTLISVLPGSSLWPLELAVCFPAGAQNTCIHLDTCSFVLALFISHPSLKVCPPQDTFCVYSNPRSHWFHLSTPHGEGHAAPPGTAFHMIVPISGCLTESPTQGFLSSFINSFFFFFLKKYWIIGLQLGSASELAMELCENKEAASRDYDSGWPDPLHLYKVLQVIQRHRYSSAILI